MIESIVQMLHHKLAIYKGGSLKIDRFWMNYTVSNSGCNLLIKHFFLHFLIWKNRHGIGKKRRLISIGNGAKIQHLEKG